MSIHQVYAETCGRAPQNRELFVHDGHVHVYRQRRNSWEDLGPQKFSADAILGSLTFEVQDGIYLEGPPNYILQFLFRAFYEQTNDAAHDLVETIFGVFKECGWRGPIEADNEKVPGTLTLYSPGEKHVYEVDDLRIVMAQLQDPEHNGWLQFDEGGTIVFVQVRNARRIEIDKTAPKERNEPDEDAAS